MKLLVMNNNIMYEDENGFYIYKETGKFFTELQEIGHDVNVFQFSELFQGNNYLADYNLRERGLKISNIKRRKSRNLAFLKAFIKGISEVRKVDFIYLFYPGHICTLIGLYSVLFHKPFGFYVRGEQNILSPLSKFLYRRASIIFTISPKFTELISNIGGRTQTVRPMMIYGEEDIITDRTYNSKDHYNLLFVGRIEEDKGVFEIVNALSQLISSSTTNFTMHFVGDGVNSQEIKTLIRKENLLDFVKFHGTITDKKKLKEFYKTCDLFVFPSHHEGFPRVLYEAMIFGVPIITSFVGTISSLMKDKINCYEVEPENSNHLKDKIDMFLKNYTNVAQVAFNGRETIEFYLSDKKLSHAEHLNQIIKRK